MGLRLEQALIDILSQIKGGVGYSGFNNRLRSSLDDQVTALISSLGSQVDDVVGAFDHV